MDEKINDFSLVRQIDHQPQRLAQAAPTGQIGRRQRVERGPRSRRPTACPSSPHGTGTALRRHRGISSRVDRSMCPFIARIQPILEQTTVIGSRSIIASIGTSATSPASAKPVRRAPPSGLGAELRAHLAQFLGNRGSIAAVGGQQILQPRALFHQRVAFADQLHLFQPPQGPQAHVQDRLGLNLGQFAIARQRRLVVAFRRGADMVAPQSSRISAPWDRRRSG
jgi:hypothetical protein